MRITVCELPHSPEELNAAWIALCDHAAKHRSELLLLPECAFIEPVWETKRFETKRWIETVALADDWHRRFPELNVPHVVGARPVSVGRNRYIEGFVWSQQNGYLPLRRKYFLPSEPGGWEANWFARGDWTFPSFSAGNLSFGMNICTELWALESYGAYASLGINAILSPRATETATINKWLSVGTIAAVRSGAYCLSSNRKHFDGSYGGVGWIIGPNGELLATTSVRSPFVTLDIDLNASAIAQRTYPRYVFDEA
jgi:predicted amidohydrolase